MDLRNKISEQFISNVSDNKDSKEENLKKIGILGKPNAGKSTLLNHLIGHKLCITSRKPQTSRHNILGIKQVDNCQLIFIDTPGMHEDQVTKLNKIMNKSAKNTIIDADIVLFVLDRLDWDSRDKYVVKHLKKINRPIICVLNKVDLIKDKNLILPHIEKLRNIFENVTIVPISALKKRNLGTLEDEIITRLPVNPIFFQEIRFLIGVNVFSVQKLLEKKLLGSWVKSYLIKHQSTLNALK